MKSASIARWALIALFTGTLLGFIRPDDHSSQDLVVLPFVLYGLVGVRVTAADPRNPLGWTFLSVGALTGLAALAGLLEAVGTDGTEVTAWYGVVGAWIDNWFWYPLLALATMFTVLLFPNGVSGRGWRTVAGVLIGYTAAITVVGMLEPTLTLTDSDYGPTVDNPVGVPIHTQALTWVPAVLVAMGFGLGTVSFVGLVRRYRAAGPVVRLQIRWFMAAGGALLGWVAVSIMIDAFLPGTPGWVSDVGLTFVLSLIPLACGFAILRYHLYDLDRIVSRTTSYAIVTGLVAGTYAVVVTTTTRLLPESSTFGVATATLAAAAVARPVLRRIQKVVDRRFDRTRYDQVAIVESFGDRMRDTVDPDDVARQLMTTVQTALQPRSTALSQEVRP